MMITNNKFNMTWR